MLRRAVIVLLALSWATFATHVIADPAIHFDAEVYDFGEVIHGASPSTEFTVSNTGDDTLIIEKLRSNCGCTKGIRGSREIPPGGTSTVLARIFTEGLSPGRHGNTITVSSNDPKRPAIRLRLRYTVVRHISVAPQSVVATVKERSAHVTLPLKAKNHWKKTIVLTSEAGKGATEKTELLPGEVVVPAGAEVAFQIRVPVRTKKSSRYCSGIATIHTSDPDESRLRVRYLIRLPKPDGEGEGARSRKSLNQPRS